MVNPKWVESMKRHGYKGAFELAATVDYMFGYDATAEVVEDWMYEGVTESYVLDPNTREFFQLSNPWALKSVVERLLEAIQARDVGEPPGGHAPQSPRALSSVGGPLGRPSRGGPIQKRSLRCGLDRFKQRDHGAWDI